MRGALLWARITTRRHVVATVLLAIFLGAATGTVIAAVAAADRADGSFGRYLATIRSADGLVYNCPKGVDIGQLEGQAAVNAACLNPGRAAVTAQRMAGMPGVEAIGAGGAYVAGVLDPTAPNGWGRGGLIMAIETSDLRGATKLLAGRLPDPAASDEVLVTAKSRDAGVRVGDRLTLRSWTPDHLDAGVAGGLPPDLPGTLAVRVVGIGRFPSDLIPGETNDISDAYFPGEIHVFGATAVAMRPFASYGVAAAVRLSDGPAGLPALQAALQKRFPGETFSVDSANQTSDGQVTERRIDLERHAVLTFALIAGLATAAVGGLTLTRQLRREQDDLPMLRQLGMTRRDLAVSGLARSVVIAIPTVCVATITTALLSPLTPLGLAGRAEPTRPVYIDGLALAIAALVLLVVASTAGLLTPLVGGPRRAPTPSASKRPGVLGRRGAVAATAGRFAHGGWPRAAAGAAAFALVAVVAGATATASLHRVTTHPTRYGAWWDAELGDYSDPHAYKADAQALVPDPSIIDIAGISEAVDTVEIAGVPIGLGAFTPEKGSPGPVVLRGHAPTDDHEIALGARTLRRLHAQVGEPVTVSNDNGPRNTENITLTVTGVALFDDPISTSTNLGDLAIVTPTLLNEFAPAAPQRIAVRFRPGTDVAAAARRLARSYHGGMRLAHPPGDVRNLEALRSLPWLLSAFVGILAAGTLLHALVVTVLARRRDLAVLRVLGLPQRGARSIMSMTTLLIVATAVAVGVPLGLVGGRLLWGALADSAGVPSGAVIGVGTSAIVIAATFVIAELVTRIATWRALRATSAELLRST